LIQTRLLIVSAVLNKQFDPNDVMNKLFVKEIFSEIMSSSKVKLLYRSFLREARKFNDYNFRNHAIRKAKYEFEILKS
jgi:hypothetical protein